MTKAAYMAGEDGHTFEEYVAATEWPPSTAAVQTYERPSRDVPPEAASGVPIANCAGCGSHFRQEAAEQTLCSQCRYWQVVYRAVFPKGNP